MIEVGVQTDADRYGLEVDDKLQLEMVADQWNL